MKGHSLGKETLEYGPVVINNSALSLTCCVCCVTGPHFRTASTFITSNVETELVSVTVTDFVVPLCQDCSDTCIDAC